MSGKNGKWKTHSPDKERGVQMKMAVPTDDGVTIAAHAGRCRGFVIYEIIRSVSHRIDYRNNTFTHHAQQPDRGDSHECSHDGNGVGRHSHISLLEAISDCDTFLAVGIGHGLVNDLQAHSISVLFSEERQIDRAIAMLALSAFVSNPQGSACCHKS